VPVGFTIVAARSIPESDFADDARILQVVQRIVNGRVADGRQFSLRLLEDLGGGLVMLRLIDDSQHSLAPMYEGRYLPGAR